VFHLPAAPLPQPIKRQQEYDQQAWQDAGQEQVVDRHGMADIELLRHHTIEYQRQRWREQQTYAARDGDQPEAVAFRIASLLEGRIQQAAECHDGHAGSAGERGEHRADDQCHRRQPAGHPAEEHIGDAHQAMRRLRFGQQVTGESEQRDREQYGHLRDAVDRDDDDRQIHILVRETQHHARRDHREQRCTEQHHGDERKTGQDHSASLRPRACCACCTKRNT
jgi:hypothetical protein